MEQVHQKGTEFLILHIDGVHAGGHQVIVAVGVDSQGYKQILGLAEGATENAVVVKGLLEDLVARGITPERPYLFVIDGAKACGRGSGQCLGRTLRCNGAASTRSRM